MTLPFVQKIASASERYVSLPLDDRAALMGLCDSVRSYGARRDIIREREQPEFVHVMIEGWACRYKVLGSGARQVTAFLVPGDFCDTHVTLFDRMDHSIGAVTDCRVALIPGERIRELMERPAIARAFWWASLIDEAVLRAWIVNLGRREAFARLGNLILELHARLKLVGLASGDSFELPLTQEELADALGLTSVHVNRTLRRLREEGLAEHRAKRLVIADVPRLRALVGFDAGYLHLPGSS